MASIADEHVVPGQRPQRRAHAPRLRLRRQRRVAGFAEPVVRRRIELARRVEGKPRVAVLAVRLRQAVAPLDPRGARGARRRCARRARARTARGRGRRRCPRRTRPCRARRSGSRLTSREFAVGDAILARKVAAERLRETRRCRPRSPAGSGRGGRRRVMSPRVISAANSGSQASGVVVSGEPERDARRPARRRRRAATR